MIENFKNYLYTDSHTAKYIQNSWSAATKKPPGQIFLKAKIFKKRWRRNLVNTTSRCVVVFGFISTYIDIIFFPVQIVGIGVAGVVQKCLLDDGQQQPFTVLWRYWAGDQWWSLTTKMCSLITSGCIKRAQTNQARAATFSSRFSMSHIVKLVHTTVISDHPINLSENNVKECVWSFEWLFSRLFVVNVRN